MYQMRRGVTVLAALLLAACSQDENTTLSHRGELEGEPVVIVTQSAAELDAVFSASGLQSLSGAAECDVTVAQIKYRTPGVQPGEMSNASAAVLIPGGTQCPGPFPLIAYARATNLDKNHTVADVTAPETLLLMGFFAAQGYALVATDYLGYALSDYAYHPYLHADSEASSVIDSIRAARNAATRLGLRLNGKLLLTGYSQGGHASMATHRAIEREHSGEFELIAAAHLAGPYPISAELVDALENPIVGVETFLPFEITAWQKVYGNVYENASDIFNAPYAGYIESLLPTLNVAGLSSLLPVGTPQATRDAMFEASFLANMADHATNQTMGALIAAKKQDLLGWDPKAPTTLCGGLGDPTVKFDINAKPTYDDFKSRGGDNVTLVDVDPEIRQIYGAVLAADPATYSASYHGRYESPLCARVAKQMFDQYK